MFPSAVGVSLDLSTPTGITCIYITLVVNGKSGNMTNYCVLLFAFQPI